LTPATLEASSSSARTEIILHLKAEAKRYLESYEIERT
jgi:hypothetical protein